MPYIHIRTAQPLTQKQIFALKTDLGQAVTLIPGKDEKTTLVDIERNADLFLGGTATPPAAVVQLTLSETQDARYLLAFSKRCCEIISITAGIPIAQIIVLHSTVVWHAGRHFTN